MQEAIMSISEQMQALSISPSRLRQSYRDHAQNPVGNFALFEAVRDELLHLDVHVEESRISPTDFEEWLLSWPEVTDFYRQYGQVAIEKCLEHYLSTRECRLQTGDVLVDVAAAGSPYAQALNNRGITAYSLDLSYPPGMHGSRIGADATQSGLPNAFADALTLHCAYECFMGDADTLLLSEAARILKPGGRLFITPLYIDDSFYNITSPFCDQVNVKIDPGAERVWRDDQWKEPFSRHYSATAFVERVWSQLPNSLSGTILFHSCIPQLMSRYPGQTIYCLFALLCRKAMD